ncbi:MAG: hypothetical protein K9J16_10115 [Melioribacteraceae bacterium]|nr:hypothetical protein [Melioribacteraceae bacterium]MCF8354290.1 hypothetical protein [Melioribacteraceae bacterium]MCF8394578.1 hypothetical protein [Melioribacteraceae bacterium]MCF8419753.1 hypothetical protein [Melioribacteraceae bacterium]
MNLNREEISKPLVDDHDEIAGNHEHIHDFYSRFLKNERDIIVWLPPSYYNCMRRYPVLYMHDGQNLFSPSTAFIGVDWQVDETVSKLIYSKEIEEIIVVGIYNTRDRLNEYNLFTHPGILYSNFIINELKTFIDENYRTKKDRKNTAVAGSSLGGLYSFQLIWNYSNVFGKAACLSNSFWVDDKKIFNHVEVNDKPDICKLYVDCGCKETELIHDNINMFRKLRGMGFAKDKIKFYLEKEGKHTEGDWAKRFNIPLKFLFGI